MNLLLKWRRLFVVVGLTVLICSLTLSALAYAHHSGAAGQVFSTGLVADEGGLSGLNFNTLAYQGLIRAEPIYTTTSMVFTSTSPADYLPRLQQCADQLNNLCIAVGWTMNEAVISASLANSSTLFAIVDGVVDERSNLAAINFNLVEPGYEAGALAGLMTESDVVGVIAGAFGEFHIPAVEEFIVGIRNGLHHENINAQLLVTYTAGFNGDEMGETAAAQLAADGADVIFNIAGPAGSAGILMAAQQGIWVVGVDVDQWVTLFDSGTISGSEKILTSMVREIELAVCDTIGAASKEQFAAGFQIYDLARLSTSCPNGAVSAPLPPLPSLLGLAPFHEAGPAISLAVVEEMTAVNQGLIDGSLDEAVWEGVFLPVIVRSP